jgi:fluoride exporter
VRIVGAVALGAAGGGLARYYLASWAQHRLGADFPWGTLLVNITGSLLLGFILRYASFTPTVTVEMRALLTTGFCGGYTTFSTFSYETAALMEDGRYERAALYAAASMLVSLAAVFAGFALARELLAVRGQTPL